jgi:hypothetical protein
LYNAISVCVAITLSTPSNILGKRRPLEAGSPSNSGRSVIQTV